MRADTQVRLLAVAFMVGTCSGFGWDRTAHAKPLATDKSAEVHGQTFDAAGILQAGVKKSVIFTKAVGLLQSLEHSPSCYRTAARVLVNSCQRLEQSWRPDRARDDDPENELMDHKYSYALSLAVCDLTVAKKEIDASCNPFREDALKQLPVHDKGFPLQISHEAVSVCMRALTNDGVSWTSFSGNKEQAFTICQASREDMEKDEILNTYRRTGKVVESFSELMEVQLEQWKHDLEAREAANKVHFEGFLRQVSNAKDDLVAMMQNIMKGVTGPAENVKDSLDRAYEQVTHVRHELDRVFESVRQQHSQHVVAQRAAAGAHDDLAISIRKSSNEVAQMQSIAEAMNHGLASIQTSVENRFSVLEERILLAQQATIQSADAANNATENSYIAYRLSEEAAENLRLVSIMTSDMAEDTENIKNNMGTFMKGLMSYFLSYPFLGTEWWILVISTFLVPFVGSFGLSASVTRNLLLMGVGFMTPITINLSRMSLVILIDQRPSWTRWHSSSGAERQNDSTITTTPVTLRQYRFEALT